MRLEAIEAALGMASLASFYASSALGMEWLAPWGWILLLAFAASLIADLTASWRGRRGGAPAPPA
ncbi:MAG: hypothetical protein QXG96_06750 [Candidatus Bathyarchaeia archaeon]